MPATHRFTRAAFAATFAVVLAACSSTVSTSPTAAPGTAVPSATTAATDHAPVTINIIVQADGNKVDQVNETTAKFMAAYPWITANVEIVAYDALHDKIVTAQVAGGGRYDVIDQDIIWVGEFAEAGITLDVTDRVPDEVKSGVLKGVLDGAQYKGRYYGVPWQNDVQYLHYNKAMLAKAGFSSPPATWDELEQQSLAMKEQGIIENPYVPQLRGQTAIATWTATAGGFGANDFVDASGNPTFNTDGGLKGLEYLKRLLDEGVISQAALNYGGGDTAGVLLAGQSAFTINWTFVYAASKDPAQSTVVGDIGIAPVPGGRGTNGGESLAVTKSSQHPDEAMLYALFVSSQAIQEEYHASFLPMWISSFDKPELSADAPDLWAAAKAAYAGMINRPAVPFFTAFANEIDTGIHEALLGQKTPKQALDDVAAKWDSLKSQ